MLKIVFINHADGGISFVFKTAEDLKKNDVVKVNTRYGEKFGFCVCDSFDVPEDVVEHITSRYGTKKEKLKDVVGVFDSFRYFSSPVEDDSNEPD